MKPFIMFLVAGLVIALTAAACGGSSAPDSAAKAVESYLTLRNGKDVNKLLAVTCKDYEGTANSDFASFLSMNASLQNMACQQSGTDGPYTVVKCTGSFTTQYQAEQPKTHDLSAKAYKAIQEDGQWKMCGTE